MILTHLIGAWLNLLPITGYTDPPGREAFAIAIASAPIPGGVVEARWEGPGNVFHIMFDPVSGAFAYVQPLEIHLRDAQGRHFWARPPFNSFGEAPPPTGPKDFGVDDLLDQFTSFFQVRFFATGTPGVLDITKTPEGNFLVQTEFFNWARSIPITPEIEKAGNIKRRVDLVIAPDLRIIEKRSGPGPTVTPVTYSVKSPPGAWLREVQDHTLRMARVVPFKASDFTPEHAKELLTDLSRTTDRKIVFRRNVAPGEPVDPLIATPVSSDDAGRLAAQSGVPAWRWPLLGAGILVIVAGVVARVRAR